MGGIGEAIFLVVAWLIGASAILSFIDGLLGTERSTPPLIERVLEKIINVCNKFSKIWHQTKR